MRSIDSQIHVSAKGQPAAYASVLTERARINGERQVRSLEALAKAVRLVSVVKRTGVL